MSGINPPSNIVKHSVASRLTAPTNVTRTIKLPNPSSNNSHNIAPSSSLSSYSTAAQKSSRPSTNLMNSPATVGNHHTMFKVDDMVKYNDYKCRVTFVGETKFADKLWIGIELPVPEGKHDGIVKEVEYFKCKANHGLFVRPEKLKIIPKSAIQNNNNNRNGSVESLISMESSASRKLVASSLTNKTNYNMSKSSTKKMSISKATTTNQEDQLQKVLSEKEDHIQQLLSERDSVMMEMASITRNADELDIKVSEVNREKEELLDKIGSLKILLSDYEHENIELKSLVERDTKDIDEVQFELVEKNLELSDIQKRYDHDQNRVFELEEKQVLEEERNRQLTAQLEDYMTKLNELKAQGKGAGVSSDEQVSQQLKHIDELTSQLHNAENQLKLHEREENQSQVASEARGAECEKLRELNENLTTDVSLKMEQLEEMNKTIGLLSDSKISSEEKSEELQKIVLVMESKAEEFKKGNASLELQCKSLEEDITVLKGKREHQERTIERLQEDYKKLSLNDVEGASGQILQSLQDQLKLKDDEIERMEEQLNESQQRYLKTQEDIEDQRKKKEEDFRTSKESHEHEILELKRELDALRGEVTIMKDDYELNNAALKKELEELHDNHKVELYNVSVSFEETQRKLADVLLQNNELHEEYDSKTQILHDLKCEIEELTTSRNQLQADSDAIHQERQRIHDDSEALSVEYENRQKELIELRDSYATSLQQLQELHSQCDKLKSTRDSEADRVQDLQQGFDLAQREKKSLKDEISSLQEQIAACKTKTLSDNDFTDRESGLLKRQNDLQNVIDDLSIYNNKMKEDNSSLEAAVAEMTVKLTQSEDLSHKSSHYMEELDRVLSSKVSIENGLKVAENNLNEETNKHNLLLTKFKDMEENKSKKDGEVTDIILRLQDENQNMRRKLEEVDTGAPLEHQNSLQANIDSQVSFLNGMIAELYKENETLKEKLQLYQSVELTNDEKSAAINKYRNNIRKFCELCDMWDHDESECPSREIYCEFCQKYGHNREDCDEETY